MKFSFEFGKDPKKANPENSQENKNSSNDSVGAAAVAFVSSAINLTKSVIKKTADVVSNAADGFDNYIKNNYQSADKNCTDSEDFEVETSEKFGNETEESAEDFFSKLEKEVEKVKKNAERRMASSFELEKTVENALNSVNATVEKFTKTSGEELLKSAKRTAENLKNKENRTESEEVMLTMALSTIKTMEAILGKQSESDENSSDDYEEEETVGNCDGNCESCIYTACPWNVNPHSKDVGNFCEDCEKESDCTGDEEALDFKDEPKIKKPEVEPGKKYSLREYLTICGIKPKYLEESHFCVNSFFKQIGYPDTVYSKVAFLALFRIEKITYENVVKVMTQTTTLNNAEMLEKIKEDFDIWVENREDIQEHCPNANLRQLMIYFANNVNQKEEK